MSESLNGSNWRLVVEHTEVESRGRAPAMTAYGCVLLVGVSTFPQISLSQFRMLALVFVRCRSALREGDGRSSSNRPNRDAHRIRTALLSLISRSP
jgi:hypothetical protein